MTRIEVLDRDSSSCDARLGFGSPHNLDFGVHRTHLSCDHESSPHHPQVRERKQGLQLGGVLGQAPVAHLGVAKLALDHPERMFNLGADAGLGFFCAFRRSRPLIPIDAGRGFRGMSAA